jgi:hypothetical protein
VGCGRGDRASALSRRAPALRASQTVLAVGPSQARKALGLKPAQNYSYNFLFSILFSDLKFQEIRLNFKK